MIWGDQWLCPCGFANFWLRKRCRNCGEPQLPDEKLETVFEAIERVKDERHE